MEYKGYNITGDGKFGYRVIKNIGPGTIPSPLAGVFTGPHPAERAIDVYISVKEKEDARKQAYEDAKPTPIVYKKPKKG